MAEYIESICRRCFHSYVCEQFNEHRDSNNEKCHFFNDHFVPAADVAPVVHGRWIYHECVSSYDGTVSVYSCSECNAVVDEEIFDMDEFHKKFCGNCGARMDGGNE